MTETKVFQCPNCGSPLNLQGEAIEIKCAYCGTAVIVPEELRPRKAPTPVSFSTPKYTIPQYNDEELSKQISTVGKVATGIAVSTMVAPIVITLVIFCVVGAFVAFILFSVNSTVKTALNAADPSALQTSIAATLLPAIAEIPTEEPTDVPPTDEPTETATPTPTAVPVSTPFSKVLFHDNFTAKKGWSVYSDAYYTLAYVKGGYRMFIDSDGGQTTWLNNLNYKDINVAVDVKYVDGPEDGRFGVACRVKESSGFYGFEFSPNGWYAIEKYTTDNDKSTSDTLAEGNMDTSNFSKDAIFHLRGDCVGHTLTLYMNDEALLQVTDSSYSSGSIGLSASTGASGDPGVDVLFSNYSVTGK
jgi:DNA-directed RNA polymerase subunit RPC12/RpoP